MGGQKSVIIVCNAAHNLQEDDGQLHRQKREITDLTGEILDEMSLPLCNMTSEDEAEVRSKLKEVPLGEEIFTLVTGALMKMTGKGNCQQKGETMLEEV